MPGRFMERPDGAAPLFTPGPEGSGALMARRRWEAEREATERALIQAAREVGGDDLPENLTLEQAMDYVLRLPLMRKAFEGHVAATKLLLQQLDRLRGGAQAETQIDARQVHIHTYQLGRPQAMRLVEDLRDAGKVAAAATVEAQIGDGDGPFTVEVPIGG